METHAGIIDIRYSRRLRAGQFFYLASHISLIGIDIQWARTLEVMGKRDHRRGLLSLAVEHANLACTVKDIGSPVAVDLSILAWLHRSIALRLDYQNEEASSALVTAIELQTTLQGQNQAVLPDTPEVMHEIKRDSWKIRIPEAILAGENKTLYMRLEQILVGLLPHA